ncbi:MAG: (Fe-S)-binding protein [Pseudomonadota bacterium]
MSSDTLVQNRLGWVTPDLQTAKSGELLYFTGCLPYFSFLFKDIGVESPFERLGERAGRGAVSTLKLLNAAGLTPVVMNEERCCGHDYLWNGDTALFERLARFNIAAIKKRGVKRIVSSCPECVRTLSMDYPQIERLDVEVLHTSQLLSRLAAEGRLQFKALPERTVTFQDPCRLGRHLGVFDEPRALLGGLPGVTLKDMVDSRGESTCCGGPNGWINCGGISRQIQIARLAEAQATGAGTLVTACPKCQIHLGCGQLGSLPEGVPAPSLEITDLSTILAEALAD